MDREMVWNFVKIGLLGLLTVLLVVRIWQSDSEEQRLLDLRGVIEEQDGKLTEVSDGVTSVADEVKDLKREFEKGLVFAKDAGGPAPKGGANPEGGRDLRTLPYWPSEDNILVDIASEPKPPANAPRGGIIKYYLANNPKSLNLHTTSEAELQEKLGAPVLEKLGTQSRRNPDDYIPGFCNRVTVNDDYTEFTCYVRKGMFWHRPFLTPSEKRGRLKWLAKLPPQEATADDVKFTFDLVQDPLSQCGNVASYLKDLKEVVVVDRYTVKVIWKRSLYYNKSSTLDLIEIYPKFIYARDEDGTELSMDLAATTFSQHWHNGKMCGTGPFKFAGFEPNQFIKLRRNGDWWGDDKPVIDGVDLFIREDPQVRLNMFKAGELDILRADAKSYNAEYLQGGALKDGIDSGKYTLKEWEMFSYYFVAWNLRNPRLQDKAVRHALAHLFPAERIIRDVYFGLATPHNSPVHKFENQYDRDLPKFPFDPKRAAELLDSAGWTLNSRGVREKVVEGERLELKLKFLYPPSSGTARDMVLLYSTSAKQVGILLEPQPRKWMQMTGMLDDKNFDVCTLGWGNTWDGDPTQIWHSSEAKSAKGSNFVSYINPDLDAVIEKLKTTFDRAERLALWKKFQRIVVEDQPYCFIFIVRRPWFIQNRLGNLYLAKLRPQDWLLPWYVKEK